jgi:uncharacterized protein YndB with AHSA1/START domain
MAADDPKLALRVTRTYASPREAVFRALTAPEAVKEWFVPKAARWVGEPEIDARPGGRYRFTVAQDTRRWTIHGTYREVKPPERLVFTWEWEDDPDRKDAGDTLVTIELRERGAGTEVVLTHERFPNVRARREHEAGWREVLETIGRGLERG